MSGAAPGPAGAGSLGWIAVLGLVAALAAGLVVADLAPAAGHRPGRPGGHGAAGPRRLGHAHPQAADRPADHRVGRGRAQVRPRRQRGGRPGRRPPAGRPRHGQAARRRAQLPPRQLRAHPRPRHQQDQRRHGLRRPAAAGRDLRAAHRPDHRLLRADLLRRPDRHRQQGRRGPGQRRHEPARQPSPAPSWTRAGGSSTAARRWPTPAPARPCPAATSTAPATRASSCWAASAPSSARSPRTRPRS